MMSFTNDTGVAIIEKHLGDIEFQPSAGRASASPSFYSEHEYQSLWVSIFVLCVFITWAT